MKSSLRIVSLVAVFVLVAGTPGPAEVKLPAVIGDNMVLQRDVELPVWGRAYDDGGGTEAADIPERQVAMPRARGWATNELPEAGRGRYSGM